MKNDLLKEDFLILFEILIVMTSFFYILLGGKTLNIFFYCAIAVSIIIGIFLVITTKKGRAQCIFSIIYGVLFLTFTAFLL